ncbi:nicotinamide/nicotinic acid mononucleotide adenylyltransferase 3 isoform X2 [Hetaerina americana]|uniref:nicotinamide/nicotinic acid mononucleotide adenylyltransferase 3 isoform X2 n=1 Tax=Hetaerina americana TaxID=62018 RepID=UPI003A7F47D7
MAPSKVMLLACGSFNPPTNMHLRMFEIARDHFRKFDYYQVIGGVMSPVHDSYGKKGLVCSNHRCAMLKLALQSSGWIHISDWECQQESWTSTRQVLEHHQDIINTMLNANNEISNTSPNKRQRNDDYSWVPDEIRYSSGGIGSVKVKLLCGADLLESFAVPGLWKEEDIEAIVNKFGLVVVTRDGSNPYKFIYESDILYKCQNNISIVTEWIANEVSSTKVRRAIQRSESVRYLIQDSVIEFIEQHGLYKSEKDGNNPEKCMPSVRDLLMLVEMMKCTRPLKPALPAALV